jgi:hypothetical protein
VTDYRNIQDLLSMWVNEMPYPSQKEAEPVPEMLHPFAIAVEVLDIVCC